MANQFLTEKEEEGKKGKKKWKKEGSEGKLDYEPCNKIF